MPQKRTIFALATPPGKSGVCVIRISGPATAHAVGELTRKPLPIARYASLQLFYNPADGRVIDEGLLIYFRAPASFTGEDSAELQLHGSRAVIMCMMQVLSRMDGLRLAEPGEFSRRAFENGRMDLTQAEGLADLIDAETEMQHRQALRQSAGELSALYESWRTQLLQMLAFIEAYIDFPDEDLPQTVMATVEGTKQNLLAELSAYLADARRGEKLREGLYVAILGAPNVGKSSLMNWLAQRDIAIVSQQPGTTRDVLEVHLDIGGYPVVVADTAGLRVTLDDIEKEGIRRARAQADRADLRIAMFDAHALPALDANTLALIDERTLVVCNKADDGAPLMLPAPLQGREVICISVKHHQGLNQLLAVVEQHVADYFSPSATPLITRIRYRELLLLCQEHLQRCNIQGDIVLAAEDLRLAARALARITGKLDVEDVLDHIFFHFCIGK